MGLILLIITAFITAFIAHEGGHWLAALFFGYVIKFRLAWGWMWKIPVPRGIWTMPDIAPWKKKVIAQAGFGVEFLAIPIFYSFSQVFGFLYALAAIGHFLAYTWYAGKDSDFNWL